MNSISRYYLSPDGWHTDALVLSGDEAHHCARVLRSRPGDAIELFDGAGRSVRARIIECSKKEVISEPVGEFFIANRVSELHLNQAIPKGGNMELIIQKATELGVASIQPLITDHTLMQSGQLDKKQLKWQRIALEACKQSGQNFLPEIKPITRFSDFVAQPILQELNVVAALHEKSRSFAELLDQRFRSASLTIGPEGDFSDLEYDQMFSLGLQPICLGDIVLRVETAALYCLSVIKHEMAR